MLPSLGRDSGNHSAVGLLPRFHFWKLDSATPSDIRLSTGTCTVLSYAFVACEVVTGSAEPHFSI